MSETIGQLLAAGRRARDLTIEDVAHRTRIHHSIIRQLESDDYSNIPNLMFVKSFLKIYGEHVEVDTTEALSELTTPANEHGQQYLLGGIDPEVRERYGHLRSRIPVRPILASAAVVAALVLGGSYLATHLYGSDSEAEPVSTANAIEPTNLTESEEPPQDEALVHSAGAQEPVHYPDRPRIPKTIPLTADDLDLPAHTTIDPASIPKAAPVIRRAEAVEGSESQSGADEAAVPTTQARPKSAEEEERESIVLTPGRVPLEE